MFRTGSTNVTISRLPEREDTFGKITGRSIKTSKKTFVKRGPQVVKGGGVVKKGKQIIKRNSREKGGGKKRAWLTGNR